MLQLPGVKCRGEVCLTVHAVERRPNRAGRCNALWNLQKGGAEVLRGAHAVPEEPYRDDKSAHGGALQASPLSCPSPDSGGSYALGCSRLLLHPAKHRQPRPTFGYTWTGGCSGCVQCLAFSLSLYGMRGGALWSVISARRSTWWDFHSIMAALAFQGTPFQHHGQQHMGVA
jgi:hypothetical protein